MKYVLSNKLKHHRGITLVEMLVTLSIFSLVSIVVTYSLMASLSSRNQIRVSQQLNDELRLVLDTMELEITSGSEFQTSDCIGGICKSIGFTVATRPDIMPYKVQYKFDDTIGKINKTVQRNDGVCENLPLDPSCTFPVTSDDVNVTFANFDVVLSGTGAQRPIITVSIETESTAETGENIPLAYSSSYSPRVIQNVANFETNIDSTPPFIVFDEIVVSSASDACSGIFSDSAMTIPYDNTQNWTNNQIPSEAYTDCDFVKISYYAKDPETGILGGRYDGNIDVEGGLCLYRACSNSNTNYYGLPVGVSNGSTEVYFTYDAIPLRPGIGDYSPPVAQKINLRAKNGAGSINSPESFINIYHMGSPIPLNTDGMVARARLACWTPDPASIMLMVAPSSNNNVYQKFIHWYRCIPNDEFTSCDPINDKKADQRLELYRYNSSRFRYKPPGGSYSSWYSYIFYNKLTDSMPVSRETLYTYGFTVYDPYDESRETSIKLLEWRPDFNTGLSGNPSTLSSIGISDSESYFEDGRTFPSNPDIGSIPADYCMGGAGPDPDPTDTDSELSYTIDASISGFWSATVTLVPGGTVYTNTISITMSGNAPSVIIYIDNIDPAFAGVTLNPINATLTQSSKTRLINLQIPSDMSVGSYNVELRVEGNGATTEYVTVPLYVSQQSGGAT